MRYNNALVISILTAGMGLISQADASGQSLDAQVIAAGGEYFQNSQMSLSQTVGEAIIGDIGNSAADFSMGFQQAYDQLTAIPEPEAQHNSSGNIWVYPNPAQDALYLRFTSATPNNQLRIIVRDLTGRILSGAAYQPAQPIDISQLAPGMYLLELSTPAQASRQIRFIKR